MGIFSGIRDYFFKGGNVGLIARNLAYIYCRIEDKYGQQFPTLPERLVATATIDLAKYLQKGTITRSEVVETVKSAIDDVPNEEVVAVFGAFVFRVQLLIFQHGVLNIPTESLWKALKEKQYTMAREALTEIDRYKEGVRRKSLDDIIDVFMRGVK